MRPSASTAPPRWLHPSPARLLVGLVLAAVLLAACSSSGSTSATGATSGGGTKVQVVAAENFWGSIASQLGGVHAQVTSIITNPNTDPHDYEPTAADGRTIAEAQYVIDNGVGYDPWVPKLVAANQTSGQKVLDVGDLLGLKDGDNPHRWYFPDNVQRVIEQITAEYKKLDPADAAYFDRQQQQFETTGLAKYHQLIADIKAKYSGTPVGASESIFQGIAQATGLALITPYSYLKAISEGTDPTAADKSTVDAQINDNQIKVWVFNSQNSTPDIQTLTTEAKNHHIPVTTITETLSPAGASFQAWQSAQLQSLEQALARATGK